MNQEVDIKLFPDQLEDKEKIKNKIASKLRVHPSTIDGFQLIRKSIDARKGRPFYLLRYRLHSDESPQKRKSHLEQFSDVSNKPKVLVIGAGPAGYFAALELIEQGCKPIVLDRGKDVQARRRDLRAIQQDHVVNPDSNYCFGEGGAGTYSDGKLYTRSHKRGKIQKVLELLVEHGAKEDILYDAHPHIGSNKLPKIIAKIRESIENFGGEVHFETRVIDFILEDQRLMGVSDQNDKLHKAQAFVLATGHSARDIYKLLDDKGIVIEAKPFAFGVRVEHPQSLIDKIQYRQSPREDALPAASYKVVTQIDNCGVFSFCMCPGGLIVPAATAPGEIVVNGMSLSRRDSPYANSGIVTSIELDELEKHGYKGVFASMNYQQEIEQSIFNWGDGSQKAPAQRLVDFVEGKLSIDLPDTSYIPGVYSAPLHEILPGFLASRLRRGLKQFDRRLKGYLTNDAIVVGVESRTSSTIRIPREEDFQHPQIKGLYPCGEGAGYAGGILSAAMDGQNVAKAIAKLIKEP